jgi:GcrA cell cycle regulator
MKPLPAAKEELVGSEVSGETAGESMSGEWTPERIAALIALWNGELSTAEIGRRLGVTKNAVIGKVHRLGLAKRRPSPNSIVQTAQVIKLDALRAGMCSWPFGDPGSESFHFCGEPTLPGKPYCAQHCAQAYVKASKDRGSLSFG